MGGPYYNQISGSRIVSADRSTDHSGSDDNPVSNWVIGTDFILCVHMYDASKDTEAGTYKIQWNKDGGTFEDLAATGEINYSVGGATVLEDGTACAPSDWKCDDQGDTDVDGTEREDSNATVAFDGRDNDETEHQWAICTDDATNSSVYRFQTVDTANGNRIDSIGVYITMEAPPADLEANMTESMVISESFGQDLPLAPNVTDSMTITESLSPDLPLTPNVVDSAIIQESFVKDLPLAKLITDSHSLQEAIEIAFSDLEVSLTDIMTIAENLNPSLPVSELEASISEIMSIAESIILNREPTEDAILGEPGDFILGEGGDFILTEEQIGDLSVNISDSIIVNESISINLPLAGINISESMTISESLQTSIPLVIAIADSLIILENIGDNLPLSKLVEQSVTVQELIDSIIELAGVSISEATAIAENITGQLSAIGGIETCLSQGMTIAEAISLNIPIPINIIDPQVISESIVLNLPIKAASISDIMSIQENIQILFGDLLSTITDVLTINEVILVSLSGLALARKKGLLLHVY